MKNPFLAFILFSSVMYGQLPAPFTSSLLTEKGDLSLIMVNGIARYLDREITASEKKRAVFWNADLTSKENYEKSIAPNREDFARIIGVADKRVDRITMEYIGSTDIPAKIIETELFTGYAVRWPVMEGIHGEGILLQPKGTLKSRVVVVPDADQTPEMLTGLITDVPGEKQFARRLAENGCQVIIPALIDRSNDWSGSENLNIFTNQPHREWIYRQAFTFGRHLIGYEVQKVLAAVDWFGQQNKKDNKPVGIAGWGEGGLLSFYAAALDTRINSALVSGYFTKRDSLWAEPIYRNLSGLLKEFGDAEIASLIVPRNLVIEYSQFPKIEGPPPAQTTPVRVRAVAAPGRIGTPEFGIVNKEAERAKKLAGPFGNSIALIHNNGKTTAPVSDMAIKAFLKQLLPDNKVIKPLIIKSGTKPSLHDPSLRQKRQVREMENHIQGLIAVSRNVRDDFFWKKINSTTPETWEKDKRQYQDYFWNEVIGRIPESNIPMNPKSRKIMDHPKWTGYEVTLDVLPDVFAWGYLLLPKDLKPGEKRPVIVCQHGLSGVPSVLMDTTNNTYKGFAVLLANKGYIVFAPHFPWRQAEDYRNLQRRANSLDLTIFSFIMSQHERLLDWLTSQSWVDRSKIGFYGLSWGGKVAMRVPALLDRYSLSICSGDFNEWILKNASTTISNTYMFSPESEMFDFNIGMTFSHAEMAAMIAPRAFMVERGHGDGVGIDEWVAFEYSKVRRFYDKLNIGEKTEIEFFNGVHEINFNGTSKFIEKHFGKP